MKFMPKNKHYLSEKGIDKMKNHLYVLIIIVIVVAGLIVPLKSDSLGFRGTDRDFRKITIVSPLGGETFVAGSKQEISWHTSSSIRYVRIQKYMPLSQIRRYLKN